MSEEAAITYLCTCVLARCWRGVSMCVPAGSDGGGTTTVPWRGLEQGKSRACSASLVVPSPLSRPGLREVT